MKLDILALCQTYTAARRSVSFAQRRIKEEAMISNAEKRFLAAAAALGKSIQKGVFKRAAVIERKIGALQKRHARTARFYTLKHSAGRLEITRDEEKMKGALAQCGDYVLKTDKSLEARNSGSST